jgi:uncharacterized protein (DUF849 family)
MDKRIIRAAITGSIHTPSMSPYSPITLDQIVDKAVRFMKRGSSSLYPRSGSGNRLVCFRYGLFS